MRYLDLTLPTLAENLALDEALLLEAEATAGPELLRTWEWGDCAVVLGTGCRLAEDVDLAHCNRDGVPILRRASGGGTVLLGSGCLCFSLVLAYDRSRELRGIRSSYAVILEVIRQALAPVLPGIVRCGTSDLAVGGRKFSGNSQQRKQNYLLHHGTLLHAFDIDHVEQYLCQPKRQPDYRNNRDHRSFLMNLPIGAGELKERLRTAWQTESAALAWPMDLVRQLTVEKYTDDGWIRRL
jgi:lipoate-protein ligase A